MFFLNARPQTPLESANLNLCLNWCSVADQTLKYVNEFSEEGKLRKYMALHLVSVYINKQLCFRETEK